MPRKRTKERINTVPALVEGHDLDWGQAVEHLEYNTWNAHAGPGTPVFMVDLFER